MRIQHAQSFIAFLAGFLAGCIYIFQFSKYQCYDRDHWTFKVSTHSSPTNVSLHTKDATDGKATSTIQEMIKNVNNSDSSYSTLLGESDNNKYQAYDASESWIYGGKLKDMNQLKKEMESTFIYDLKEALKPENRQITVIVTSCNRLDLLNRTVKSFEKYNNNDDNNYKIIQRIITDDCRNHKSGHEIINSYMPEYYLLFSGNNELEKTQGNGKDTRITRSFDYSMNLVTTPWVIHLEDDWEFYKPGFINAVFDIYTNYVLNYEKYIKYNSNNKYDILDDKIVNLYKLFKYSIVLCRLDVCALYDESKCKQEWHGHLDWNSYQEYNNTSWRHWATNMDKWGGFTFNGGMLPTFIYKKWLGPLQGSKFTFDESALSERAIQLGYHVAFLSINSKSKDHIPYCQHIGENRHEYIKTMGGTKMATFT